METIAEKEIKEIAKNRMSLADDLLEAYIEYCAIYSRKHWMLFLSERLRRIENEIYYL